MKRAEVCEEFLKLNEVNSCSIISENDEGSFNPRGCDCCQGLATTTYECNGYSPKNKEVLPLGEVCGECLNYFYNAEGGNNEIEK